jgi:Holliday junction resolvasome RuvABC endonuclease subunit
MKVLGLDISSSCSGFCICEDGYLLKETIDVIKPPEKIALGEKLVFIEKALTEIINQYKPDEIIMEDIFKGPNMRTFKTLAMCRGVVFKVVWALTGKEPLTIMPTEARKALGMKGVKKEDAYAWVIKKYKFKGYTFDKDNDRTDSVVLALSYFEIVKNPIKPKIKKRRKSKKR